VLAKKKNFIENLAARNDLEQVLTPRVDTQILRGSKDAPTIAAI